MTERAVLQELRARTSAAHTRLERRLSAHALDSRQGYARYLARMYGPVEALARSTHDVPELSTALPDLNERAEKLGLLALDLGELQIDSQALPKPRLSGALDAARLFGALYVMEGSTLGGVVLARELESALGPLPTRYLRCYGAEVGGKWRAFCGALAAFITTPVQRTAAAQGAEHMFELVEGWLEEGGLLAKE